MGLFICSLLACGEPEKPKPPILEIPVVKVISQDVPISIEMIGQTYGSRDIPIRARVDGTLESMHFEVRKNGKPVNPLWYLPKRP